MNTATKVSGHYNTFGDVRCFLMKRKLQQDQAHGTGLPIISLTSTLSRGSLKDTCLDNAWKREELTRGPLVCKETFYSEQACIDRRHSSHASVKPFPNDWHAR